MAAKSISDYMDENYSLNKDKTQLLQEIVVREERISELEEQVRNLMRAMGVSELDISLALRAG